MAKHVVSKRDPERVGTTEGLVFHLYRLSCARAGKTMAHMINQTEWNTTMLRKLSLVVLAILGLSACGSGLSLGSPSGVATSSANGDSASPPTLNVPGMNTTPATSQVPVDLGQFDAIIEAAGYIPAPDGAHDFLPSTVINGNSWSVAVKEGERQLYVAIVRCGSNMKEIQFGRIGNSDGSFVIGWAIGDAVFGVYTNRASNGQITLQTCGVGN